MKGFDYLSPQGMYDAVTAYGLPSSIIDLDRAAQTDTKCFIRTAHGLTEPITITGVTKQGGSLSPVKSTLTTSLGHHYLNDINAALVAPEHPYGWLTQWPKSFAYVLEPNTDFHVPNEVEFDSITNQTGINPLNITVHKVKLIQNELDFLRAKVDNPSARYEELKAYIEDFTFPRFLRRPPITLLHKIVKQNIISKARALLSLQPIKRADAEDLDRRIKMKIHMESGMPFLPNPDILTLPTDLHGLDFPSIARINDGIAIDGLSRDLNHIIPSYRNLARITLADWMCSINGCINPVDADGLSRDFTRYPDRIPFAWIVAQSAMASKDLKITLKRTHIDGILSGHVSLSHILQVYSKFHPSPQNPNGHAINSFRGKGIRCLNDMGSWKCSVDGTWSVVLKTRPTDTKWTDAAKSNWDKLSNVLRCTNIQNNEDYKLKLTSDASPC
ncbi:hypothetical protein GGX14DRAFT_580783 [Mycena pura]|uniref:Uncharacterized protein n=1 Tax=Mycena pura TaxID=153505 RepID=A0AAD6UPB2_9AGAR|nr:hypothetical protein GGX14DRAFT_580783 [Mycena pura]